MQSAVLLNTILKSLNRRQCCIVTNCSSTALLPFYCWSFAGVSLLIDLRFNSNSLIIRFRTICFLDPLSVNLDLFFGGFLAFPSQLLSPPLSQLLSPPTAQLFIHLLPNPSVYFLPNSSIHLLPNSSIHPLPSSSIYLLPNTSPQYGIPTRCLSWKVMLQHV